MKLFNYIILMTGLIIFFELAGIPTGMGALLTTLGLTGLGTTAVVFSSTFIYVVSGILAAATVGGIIIGTFSRASPENYIILPFITGTLVIFVGGFVNIIGYAIANFDLWLSSIFILILVPLTIAYGLALIGFFRGNE